MKLTPILAFKKEWLLASLTALATLAGALALLRWMAPQLLGLPMDLQMVQVSEEVVPFYDSVFREEDHSSSDLMLKDPFIRRLRPLFPDKGTVAGPHDILGFRNRGVPNSADVITIGDSQTYGENATLEMSWPSQLELDLSDEEANVYNLAVAGWGAVEYLEIFSKALLLKPRVAVIAFYAGNDPLDSFKLAYARERWMSLRPDPKLTADDMPAVTFPPPESEWWSAPLAEGLEVAFMPKYRLASNDDNPAARAGYAIMAEVGRRIADLARKANATAVFTIIPTKELAFAKKVATDVEQPPAEYVELVRKEQANIETLAAKLAALSGAVYIDVVGPLQEAAGLDTWIYPSNANGHPMRKGYEVIASALSPRVDDLLGERAPPQDETEHSRLFAAAFAQWQAGRRNMSIATYERALQLDPSHTQVAFNLSYSLMERVRVDRELATELLQSVVDRRPDYSEGILRLGQSAELRCDWHAAETAYRQFLEQGGHPDLAQQARERLRELEGGSTAAKSTD